MKLFFDARYIRTDFHDGISRYSEELAKAVAEQEDVTFIIFDEKQKSHLPAGAKTINIHSPTSPLEPMTSIVLNKYRPDVVFSPMQTMGSFGKRFKLILTTHDLIYYRHKTPPSNMNLGIRIGWRIFHMSYAAERKLLNAADAVVTVSETSKKDILDARLTVNEVTVVPNAAQDLKHLISHPVKFEKRGPRQLIYMGSFMEYKNVETLIRSMEWLPEYTLHLLSRISPKRHMELMRIIPKNAKVIFERGVSDTRYAELLSSNAILVSASYDEGYGLPLAEALTLGAPAVVSNLPIFMEVAGNGALYADPNSPKEFAQKIMTLDDKKTREDYIKRGKESIKKYSWEQSAKALISLIHTLV